MSLLNHGENDRGYNFMSSLHESYVSYTFSDHIKTSSPIRRNNTPDIFNNSLIGRTRSSSSFDIMYRNSHVTKTLVPVKYDMPATFSCLFRLVYEFPSLCIFNHTSLLRPVFRGYFFWDFFLQVLHFKMASKFQTMTHDVKAWHAMCLCTIVASYEI